MKDHGEIEFKDTFQLGGKQVMMAMCEAGHPHLLIQGGRYKFMVDGDTSKVWECEMSGVQRTEHGTYIPEFSAAPGMRAGRTTSIRMVFDEV